MKYTVTKCSGSLVRAPGNTFTKCSGSLVHSPGTHCYKVFTITGQSIWNTLLRSVRDHLVMGPSPVMRDELHWLPIRQRIEYKLCLTVFKALHGISPGYIAAMCVPVSSLALRSRLRSADLGKLSFIRTNTEFGKSAFAHAGPTAWNNIPTAVKLSSTVGAFRSALKT